MCNIMVERQIWEFVIHFNGMQYFLYKRELEGGDGAQKYLSFIVNKLISQLSTNTQGASL
jgi:hypothetical protein